MSNGALANLPIFSGMCDQERKEALGMAKQVEVKRGEFIIRQGNLVQNLWFILAGNCQVTCRTEAGCQVNLDELGPGIQFGEMSFFHEAPHSADVIALTDMELLCLSREDYDRLCVRKNPIAFKLALNSLSQLSNRLRRTDQWITNLVCNEDHHPTPSEWTSFREIVFRGG